MMRMTRISLGFLILAAVGLIHGLLFYYRLQPALTVVSLFTDLPRVPVSYFAVSGILIVSINLMALSVLAAMVFRLFGTGFTVGRSLDAAARSIYPWLLGLFPLLIFVRAADSSYFPAADNFTKLAAFGWSFYLWTINIKKSAGLNSNGRAAAGIALTVAAFIVIFLIVLVLIFAIAGLLVANG